MRKQKYTNPAFKQYEIQSKNVNDIVFSSEQPYSLRFPTQDNLPRQPTHPSQPVSVNGT